MVQGQSSIFASSTAPMTVTVIEAAANNLGITKENVLFDDFTGTLTPSLDLIYQKLEISNKIKEQGLLHTNRYIEKMSNIMIMKLILRDKIDEAYTFLDKVWDIVEKSLRKEDDFESLFEEYE